MTDLEIYRALEKAEQALERILASQARLEKLKQKTAAILASIKDTGAVVRSEHPEAV